MTPALVAVGAAVGSSLRYLLSRAHPPPTGGWPLVTLGVNLGGALLLGLLVGWLLARSGGRLGGIIDRDARPSSSAERIRALLGTGVLGSFTTFSALAVEFGRLIEAGAPVVAAAYLFTSVAGGLLAAHVGLRLGGRRAWA